MEASRFLSLTAEVVFLAVCAYVGAAVYSHVEQPEFSTVQRIYIRDSAELQGIVLRSEQTLSFDRGTEPLAEDGRRLAAGDILAIDSEGRGLSSPCSAIYFSDTDGYEHLNADAIEPMDISALEELMAEKPGDRGDGRLVTGKSWYYWAICDPEDRLPPSGSCNIQFDGMNESIPARILSLSEPENNRQAILLRLDRGGSEYLRLRMTGAKLLFSEHSGLYLPEEAIMQAPDGTDFVYTLNAGVLEMQPVEIIYTGSGFSLVREDSGAGSLHEGDRIAMGKDLYVGKVVIP